MPTSVDDYRTLGTTIGDLSLDPFALIVASTRAIGSLLADSIRSRTLKASIAIISTWIPIALSILISLALSTSRPARIAHTKGVLSAGLPLTRTISFTILLFLYLSRWAQFDGHSTATSVIRIAGRDSNFSKSTAQMTTLRGIFSIDLLFRS